PPGWAARLPLAAGRGGLPFPELNPVLNLPMVPVAVYPTQLRGSDHVKLLGGVGRRFVERVGLVHHIDVVHLVIAGRPVGLGLAETEMHVDLDDEYRVIDTPLAFLPPRGVLPGILQVL